MKISWKIEVKSLSWSALFANNYDNHYGLLAEMFG